jgi:hypothetical protein
MRQGSDAPIDTRGHLMENVNLAGLKPGEIAFVRCKCAQRLFLKEE